MLQYTANDFYTINFIAMNGGTNEHCRAWPFTPYNLDGTGWLVYSGPVVISGEGTHTLDYRATDKLTLRSFDHEREGGLQEHVKLLKPQPRVERVVKMAGFDQFFEIYTDLEVAVASF